MRVVLLALSGDLDRWRDKLLALYPDCSIDLISRAEFEKGGHIARLRSLRSLNPDVLAIATERLPWQRGGPTDLDNGALLCQYHHQQTHRQGWRVQVARNGYPELIPPVSIDPTRRPRQHHRFQLTQLTNRRRT